MTTCESPTRLHGGHTPARAARCSLEAAGKPAERRARELVQGTQTDTPGQTRLGRRLETESARVRERPGPGRSSRRWQTQPEDATSPSPGDALFACPRRGVGAEGCVFWSRLRLSEAGAACALVGASQRREAQAQRRGQQGVGFWQCVAPGAPAAPVQAVSPRVDPAGAAAVRAQWACAPGCLCVVCLAVRL